MGKLWLPSRKKLVRLSERERLEAGYRGIGNGLPPLAGSATPGSAFTFNASAVTIKQTAKTLLFLTSDTETPFDIVEFGVSCNGTTGFLLIEWALCTNKGTGEGSTEPAAVTIRGIEGIKAKTKAKRGFTEGHEPETYTLAKAWEVPLPMTPFVMQSPLGREMGSVSTTAATSGSRLGLRVTASTGEPKVLGYVEIEE